MLLQGCSRATGVALGTSAMADAQALEMLLGGAVGLSRR